MKKLILALSLMALTASASAQQVNKAALLNRIQQATEASQDAKKADKAATWINLGKAYIDAAIEPTKTLYVGAPVLVVQAMGRPVAVEQQTFPVSGAAVQRVDFEYLNVYLDAKQTVLGWTVASEVAPNAIESAIEALDKAWQVEPKQAAKIKAQLVRIADFEAQQGNAANNVERYGDASSAYEQAAAAEAVQAFGTPDLSKLYYAGTTAAVGGATDPKLFERAERMLEKAYAAGYRDDRGMIYYYLHHAYFGQRETAPEKLQKAKAILIEGRAKFPENAELLTANVNLYTVAPELGNPADLIADLDKQIAAAPQNIELRFLRAQTFVALKDYDNAVASLDGAIQIDPKSYTAQFFAGYYLVMKADALNDEANNKRYTSRADSEADQSAIRAVYARAIPYLEAAHEIDPKAANPVALLKNLTFRLRSEEGMQAKYDKYNALDQLMSAQ